MTKLFLKTRLPSANVGEPRLFSFILGACRGKLGSPSPGKEQQPQEQRYPFLSVSACRIFMWPNNGMATSVLDL